MANLYKKFGVSMKNHKPGDLMQAAKASMMKKHKHRKSHEKHEKKMACAQCEKAHAKHEKHMKGKSGDVAKNIKMQGQGVARHDKHEKKHGKNWIAGAIKKPGALHHELGVKSGHKIPAGKLVAAAKKGGKEGKRARLAER